MTFQPITQSQTPEPSQTPVEAFTPTPTHDSLSIEITDNKGVPMALVQAGEFIMGSDTDDDEMPIHTVYLDNYYVDKFEVTNVLYKACVAVSACDKPEDVSKYNNSQYANHPVVYVDWNMAKAYCEWRSAKLPTESQWEKAARGTDALTYPWGTSIDATFANYLNNIKDTREVGFYQNGRSVYGVYDLAGNVWEWVADRYGADYYFTLPPIANNPLGPTIGNDRVIRGGSWNDSANTLRSSNRAGLNFTAVGPDLGFRCAKDANP
jgi:formylglycine-generating enzyme required for sulfatase activity